MIAQDSDLTQMLGSRSMTSARTSHRRLCSSYRCCSPMHVLQVAEAYTCTEDASVPSNMLVTAGAAAKLQNKQLLLQLKQLQ